MKPLRPFFLFLLVGLYSFTHAQTKIPVGDFEQKVKSTPGAQLIDVRTPDEFSGGHLDQADNINYNDAGFETKIQKLDKSKPVFVYCLSGGRSGKAAAKMKELGFQEVYDMQGGILAWTSKDMPVVKNPDAKTQSGMSITDYRAHLKSDKLVLVDFNAPWCAPCKKMSPMLEEVSKEQKGKLTLMKINIDDNKDLAKALQVEALPVVIIYKDGKEVYKHLGEIGKAELMRAIQKI